MHCIYNVYRRVLFTSKKVESRETEGASPILGLVSVVINNPWLYKLSCKD